jgi:opacity protein-like surface antigen
LAACLPDLYNRDCNKAEQVIIGFCREALELKAPPVSTDNSWTGDNWMKKILLLATMLFVASMPAYAQDEYPKFELAGMFNLLRADIDMLGNETMYGYGVGAQFNATKRFGLVAEWSAAHGSSGPTEIFQSGTTYEIPLVDTRVQTILLGPRMSFRSQAFKTLGADMSFTVFGHCLAGAGTNKIDYFINSYTRWQFAFAVGGGVDVNVGKRFAIRVAQIDWLPILSKLNLQGADDLFSNWRYQGGCVFKF